MDVSDVFHPRTQLNDALIACYVGINSWVIGIKLRLKDMRDIVATVVTEHVTNPDSTRRLLRHTNLTITTCYLRGVKNRMMEAVRVLGANCGGRSRSWELH